MDNRKSVQHSIVIPELYFLISKFLSCGPLQKTAKVLIEELEHKKVLPKRIDWLGQEHDQTFAELERKYPHIGSEHLIEICCRIGPILDKELIPSVPGIISLLGSGRQNLLRTKESICRPRALVDYYTSIHGLPLPDSANSKNTHNLLKVLIGRESGGPFSRKLLIPTKFYSKTRLLRRTLGHLSAVYCVLFDRSGRYIVTGADDLLVKLWSAVDGRLLITFRGASAEITDIAINLDNTLLAAGSLDRILRVWDLQTAGPIAVLPGHTGMITSVNFCPSPRGDLKYLVTTSTDGSVAFWQYTTPRGAKTVFAPKPIQYLEKIRPGQAQMICASFSPGGIFLAACSADHHVRVYIMLEDGPKRILETEAHSDAVDSIQWAHRGIRFVSGSKDGTALVWSFESQQWKSMKLNMTQRLSSCPEPEEGKKIKVTMVAWDYSDKYVVTAVNDFTIKIWDSRTGALHKVLRGHKDELYVLESHPKDEHVLLSAGHDGQLFLWDIEAGVSLAHFVNCIDGQGQGGVFDAKWSPDGTMIAATDSHGHILMFGFGAEHQRFKTLPRELFFHTDYRPLLRDANHMVMDEQTQLMPHLMPPPFLVDVDGNPHPPIFQRLVPGRENCPSEQLVPNIAVGPEGVEVIDAGSISHLDRLIEALANRQGQDQAPDSNNDRVNGDLNNGGIRLGGGFGDFNNDRANGNFNNERSRLGSFSRPSPSGNMNGSSNNGHRLGLRRTGDVEGVRQSSGNWQRETTYKWMRRIYVKPLRYAALQTLKQIVYKAGLEELDIYRREMRRRPIMINTANANTALKNLSNASRRGRGTRNARRGPRPAYRTRAVREREPVEEVIPEDEEEESASNSSGDSSDTGVNEEMLSGSSSSEEESSDYSDWVADKPGPTLEPPKRSKRKPVERRNISPNSDTSQPGGSKSRGRKKIPLVPDSGGEIPEAFKPPEWLSEVIPRKAPYYPQMGDEVVYFRQGHQRYLEAVRTKKVYKVTNSSEPWRSLELRDHELVRVIGNKYEIRPPRLCCLKLALLNNDGTMTGKTFTIKYHDMPDVLDFLVLRQTYETAVARNWCPSDRFRCMIDDCWWMGQIESRVALSQDFPDSLFMCFRVRWDNGEYEYMSPWDMEPIDENRLPDDVGGAVPVLPEELRSLLYQPKPEEWPRGDRDASCRRIITGLEQVMGLAIADPFLAPVDLNIYPSYAYVVEYPIDLTTIKARFENHFYRRINAAQFDVRYLATNAEKFNQSHSNIVKHARIITDLCLAIIGDPNIDVGASYHRIVDTYISSESEEDNEAGPSTSTGGPTTPSSARKGVNKKLRRHIQSDSGDWRIDCRELLDLLWQCDDSSPFREPVDTLEHPDYLQIVDTPMDLRTIKEDLLGGNYSNPLEFAKDVRLMFQNSRNYNTNKRSRIFAMTIRLSNLFEDHMRQLVYNWKSARRRADKEKKKAKSPQDRNKPGPSSRPGPSTRANGNIRPRVHHSDEDDDDDDNDDNDNNNSSENSDYENEIDQQKRSRGRVRKNARIPKKNILNGGISSSNIILQSVAGPSGRNLRRNASRPNSQEDDDESDNEEVNVEENDENSASSDQTTSSNSTSSNSSSNSDDDNDDDSDDSQVVNLGKKRQREDDSEDSYNPNDKRVTNKAKKRKNTSRNKRGRKPKRNKFSSPCDKEVVKRAIRNKRSNRRKKNYSDDNEESEEDIDSEENSNSKPKRGPGRPPKTERSIQPPSAQKARPNSDSDNEISASSRLRGNRRMHDTDHSYHLIPSRTSRRNLEESESEHDTPRPVRTRHRRIIPDENEAEEREQRSKRLIPKKKTESDHSQEDIASTSIAGAARDPYPVRTVRTNRNSRVLPEEETDDDDDDDNEPLANHLNINSTQQSQRRKRIRALNDYRSQNGGHLNSMNREQSRNTNNSNQINSSHVISRRAAATQGSAPSVVETTSTTVTRSHVSSTSNNSINNSDAVPSSSTTLRGHVFQSHVQVDHNYGEPGPSAIRHTRRLLSRHQRNADELDPLSNNTDETLQLPAVVENVSSRLRIRHVNSTTVTRNGVEIPERQIRLASLRNNNIHHHLDENTNNYEQQSSEVTDSEDNEPLTAYVRSKISNNNVEGTSNIQTRILRKRQNNNHFSSDEDYENHRDSNDSYSYERVSRATRNVKRPHYNENTDDDSFDNDDNSHIRRKRKYMRTSPNYNNRQQKINNIPSTSTRTRTITPEAVTNTSSNSTAATKNYDDAVTDSDNEQLISISSRGRIRKITAKARGLFRD